MARTRKHRYGYMVLAALAALPLGTADASPIPPQITYSTTWPGPMSGLGNSPVFEFQGVENGTAAPDSIIKLGTVLIHQTSPRDGFTFDNEGVRVDFTISAVDGKPIAPIELPISLDVQISGTVHPDGTVAAGMIIQGMYNRMDPFGGYIGGFGIGELRLKLGEVRGDDMALWSRTPGTPVVAVDIYGELTDATVPEPGAWLVFAGATGFFALMGRSQRAKAA
ncbi:hypothetical protein [Paludisphaera borealis]|uniref:PEP-CTERM protein-sorting domain-containing protein n=1 Tax=Paludisphaera borealis TaxID=1387353 RepID=A0A1U7CQC4_9BACT|nr:hypothetical protein [Paludisphaera borealis]APW61106.1 hypothetical protein BSF38_02610 [Paludisphaera borealis]